MGVVSCEEKLRIRAMPDGRELQFTTEIIMQIPGYPESNTSTTMWMKRVPQEGARVEPD
jgi:hypothetical protein